MASSGGRHGDLVAEGLEPVGEPSADVLAVALVEVVGTEVVERLATPQDLLTDDDLAVADADARPLATPSRGDPMVLGTEIGRRPTSAVGRVDEDPPEPGTALPGPAGAAFAGRLVVARTHPGPRREVAGRGEAGHVSADLGEERLGGPAADARDRHEPPDRLIERAQADLDLGAHIRDVPIELIEPTEHRREDEPLVRADAPRQSLFEGGSLAAHPSPGEPGEGGRIGLALDERPEDRQAGHASDVGGDRGELDVGALEHLLDPVDLRRSVPDERGSVAGQLAQLAFGPGRDEARPQEAVAEEIGDPLRVTDVGLAPRHGLQVRGVDDEQLEAGLEDVVDRLPERPGALHRDNGDAGFGQPVGEREQLAGGRSERSDLAGGLRSRTRGQPTGDDRALVDIEPGAAGMDDLHGDASRPDGREDAHLVRECLACSSGVRATDGDTCERPGRSQDRAQRTNSSRPVVPARPPPFSSVVTARAPWASQAPAKLVVLAALSGLVGGMRAGAAWIERERSKIEIAADDHALANGASRAALARAILKLSDAPPPLILAAFASATDLRMRALIGGEHRAAGPSHRLAPTAVLAAALVVVACSSLSLL